MLYSVVDENHKELTDNKLRNEIIWGFKNDRTSVEFNGEKYHIEGMKAERKGFKQISYKKD